MLTGPDYDREIENFASRISELEEEIGNLRFLDDAISRNTAMFEALIANSCDGITLTGPDRRIVRVVRAALGCSPGDVVGAPIESLMHPDDQGILVDCYEQLLNRSANSVEFEGRVCRPDGSIQWVLARFTDMLDNPNVQAIVCNYADVTKWKERDLIMAEFAAIVESADRAIFSKGLDGVILTWNAGAQKFYGYSPEEVLGRHIWILFPQEHQDEEQRTRKLIGETARPLELRTLQVRKDGSRISVLVQLVPVLDRYARPRGILHSSVLLVDYAAATRDIES